MYMYNSMNQFSTRRLCVEFFLTLTFVRSPVFERYKDVSFKETIVFLLTDYLTFQMIQYSKKTYDWLLQPRRTSVTAEYMII